MLPMSHASKNILGELETEIMEIIWKRPGSSVRAVLNQLEKKRKVAYTTVMTVMSRLHDKGILKREAYPTGAYLYAPVQNKERFLAAASKKAIDRLIKEFGNVAIAQFLDVMENYDAKKTAQWRRKLKNIS